MHFQHVHHIKTSRIRRLGWCNAREMVADGLSKGAVPKDALMFMCTFAELNLSSMTWPSSQAESVSDLQC
eukprot:5312708-Amphidinium_carterae.1